jgi:hypothetical protein
MLAPGARVIVLDGAAIPLTTSLDDVGQHVRYRIGPPNADVASAAMREISTIVGTAPLRPLAPVRLQARRLPSGISLSWIRRSRVGGDFLGSGRNSTGRGNRTLSRDASHGVARPIRVVEFDAPAMLYDAAQELADFGSPQLAALDVEVAQLSVVAGPGLSRRGLVTVR